MNWIFWVSMKIFIKRNDLCSFFEHCSINSVLWCQSNDARRLLDWSGFYPFLAYQWNQTLSGVFPVKASRVRKITQSQTASQGFPKWCNHLSHSQSNGFLVLHLSLPSGPVWEVLLTSKPLVLPNTHWFLLKWVLKSLKEKKLKYSCFWNRTLLLPLHVFRITIKKIFHLIRKHHRINSMLPEKD